VLRTASFECSPTLCGSCCCTPTPDEEPCHHTNAIQTRCDYMQARIKLLYEDSALGTVSDVKVSSIRLITTVRIHIAHKLDLAQTNDWESSRLFEILLCSRQAADAFSEEHNSPLHWCDRLWHKQFGWWAKAFTYLECRQVFAIGLKMESSCSERVKACLCCSALITRAAMKILSGYSPASIYWIHHPTIGQYQGSLSRLLSHYSIFKLLLGSC